MRKIVIFTMILTLIFGTVGCTAHSKPDKKAIENLSTNAVIDTTQSEELTEKTEDETVEKSTFAEEKTQTTTAETGTEKVPNETIYVSSPLTLPPSSRPAYYLKRRRYRRHI